MLPPLVEQKNDFFESRSVDLVRDSERPAPRNQAAEYYESSADVIGSTQVKRFLVCLAYRRSRIKNVRVHSLVWQTPDLLSAEICDEIHPVRIVARSSKPADFVDVKAKLAT
jgi:hypothetical protein